MILIKNRLNAGFFSNLNAAITWFWYSMRTGIPIYVHWDGIENKNAMDLFFIQHHTYEFPQYSFNANFQHSPLFTDQLKEALREDVGDELFDKYDGWFFCQGSVYTHPNFQLLRNLYHHVYSNNLSLLPTIANNIPFTPKTLGVNYRFIHFYFTGDGKRIPFNTLMSSEEYNKKYMDQIESTFENGKFDNIYLASSQRPFFEKCHNKFKDKLLYLPMKRLDENQTEYERGVSLLEEHTNVMKDVINLTLCDHLIVSPSNLIFGALYINPTVSFEIMDFLKDTHTS